MVGISHSSRMKAGVPGHILENYTKLVADRAERKLEGRRKLLAAARRLFTERGYHQTRPQDICREAGVGFGTFYRQFEDKFDCFLFITNEAVRELTGLLQSDLYATTTFEEGLRTILCRSFDYSAANPGMLRAIMGDLRVLSADKSRPFISSAPEILALIEKWKQQGEIKHDFDTNLLSYLISGLIRQGDFLINQNLGNRDEVVGSILSFLMRGVEAGRISSFEQQLLTDTPQPTPHTGEEASNVEADNIGAGHSQRKFENRRKLFTAAKKLFAEQGYDAVGPREIAGLAGVGVATFYCHFEDKLDCFLAVTDEATAELHSLGNRRSTSVATFPETVRALVQATFDYSAANPGLYRAMAMDIKILSDRKSIAKWRSRRICVYIEEWKKMGKVGDCFDSNLLGYLIAGAMNQSDDYILSYPEKRDETIERIKCFILSVISVD